MSTRRNLQLLWFLPILLFSPGLSAPIQAQRANSLTDDQVREVAERTVKKASSGSTSNERLSIRRRQDLEELLLTLEAKKPVNDVYFYELRAPPGTVSEASSVWVVAVARSTREAYKLYSFEGSAGPNAPSEEFNRFISQLALSIPEEKATSLARLFLGSCLEGDAEEIVLDESMELRLAVQNYYFASYGDIWRALDAYAQWWQGSRANALAIAPTIGIDKNGRYRVVLNRLLTFVEKHPQVQEWELEISREGKIRVLAMRLIFPDQQSWLFYDLPLPFPSLTHSFQSIITLPCCAKTTRNPEAPHSTHTKGSRANLSGFILHLPITTR